MDYYVVGELIKWHIITFTGSCPSSAPDPIFLFDQYWLLILFYEIIQIVCKHGSHSSFISYFMKEM